MTFETITSFATQIEGPYKWYILGAIILIITALVTKVIFHTFKWILLIFAVGFVIYFVWNAYGKQSEKYWPESINRAELQEKADILRSIQGKVLNK